MLSFLFLSLVFSLEMEIMDIMVVLSLEENVVPRGKDALIPQM